jgi:hypothetical protein
LFERWELIMDNAWNERHQIYTPIRLFTVSGMFTIFFGWSKVLQECVPGQGTAISSVNTSMLS